MIVQPAATEYVDVDEDAPIEKRSAWEDDEELAFDTDVEDEAIDLPTASRRRAVRPALRQPSPAAAQRISTNQGPSWWVGLSRQELADVSDARARDMSRSREGRSIRPMVLNG